MNDLSAPPRNFDQEQTPPAGVDSIEAQADAEKNILRVRYHGHVTAQIMENHLAELSGLLPSLEAGFVLATDLSDLRSMDLDCSAGLMKVMDRIKAHGVGAIARLIPHPEREIGFAILSQFHYPADIRIITCETAEEFEKLLSDDD